jgi:hypothetical protein
VSDGTKEFVLFLFEIDFEKAFFIAIPEEVAEFVDQCSRFPRRFGFPFDLSFFFLLSLLPFEVLDLEHPLGNDGAFGVEQIKIWP